MESEFSLAFYRASAVAMMVVGKFHPNACTVHCHCQFGNKETWQIQSNNSSSHTSIFFVSVLVPCPCLPVDDQSAAASIFSIPLLTPLTLLYVPPQQWRHCITILQSISTKSYFGDQAFGIAFDVNDQLLVCESTARSWKAWFCHIWWNLNQWRL